MMHRRDARGGGAAGIRAGFVTVLTALVMLSATGCDTNETAADDWARYVGAYVDPSHEGGVLVLEVTDDMEFTLALHDDPLDPSEGQETELAAGSWQVLGGGIELVADRWQAVLMPDEVPVSFIGQKDTLPGLRWQGGTESGPLASVQLVRHQSFVNLVRPPEGTGSEGM